MEQTVKKKTEDLEKRLEHQKEAKESKQKDLDNLTEMLQKAKLDKNK